MRRLVAVVQEAMPQLGARWTGEWLGQRFLAHRGNADAVCQELEREKGFMMRFETPPGQQLQADFGQCVVRIGGERERVHLAVLTLGDSRRLLVRAFRSDKAGALAGGPGGRISPLGRCTPGGADG